MFRAQRLTVLLVVALAAPAFAAASSSPGAGSGPPVPVQSILKEDPRLEKTVTLREERAPLSEVTAELARQTGVTLQAAADTADEPAIVFVTDRPAKEVMHHLAVLFNYRWRRSGAPGDYRYEIYQDLTSRTEEEALRQQARLRVLGALQEELRLYAQLAALPPEELRREAEACETAVERSDQRPAERRRAGDPIAEAGTQEQWLPRLRAMADPRQRALVRMAAAFTPAQWNALLAEGRIYLSADREPGFWPLPPAAVEEWRAAPPSWVSQEAWARVQGLRVYVEVDLNPGLPSLSLLPMAIGLDRRGPLRLQNLLLSSGAAPIEAAPPAEAVASSAADPVLGARRRIKMDADPDEPRHSVGWLSRMLPVIAKTYGVNLVADGYRAEKSPAPPFPTGEEMSLAEALNRYVRPAADWTREGAFLRVRRHQWYYTRLEEVPARVVKQWSAYLRQRPALSLEDAAALALALRDEQLPSFETLMHEEGIRLPEGLDALVDEQEPGGWDLLRAYGSLPQPLRQQLRAGRPLPYTAMPLEARRRLHLALRHRARFSDTPFLLDEIASGALEVGLRNLEPTAAPADDGAAIEPGAADAPEARSGDGAPGAPEDPAAPRMTTPPGSAPLAAGRVLRQVNFRYRYGAGQVEDFAVILPWIRLSSTPAVGGGAALPPGAAEERRNRDGRGGIPVHW